MVSHYDILGVPSTADAATIKKAYRKKALSHHPDKNPDKENATAQFQKIGEAFSILKSPTQRHQYDQELQRQRRPFATANPFAGASTNTTGTNNYYDFNDGYSYYTNNFQGAYRCYEAERQRQERRRQEEALRRRAQEEAQRRAQEEARREAEERQRVAEARRREAERLFQEALRQQKEQERQYQEHLRQVQERIQKAKEAALNSTYNSVFQQALRRRQAEDLIRQTQWIQWNRQLQDKKKKAEQEQEQEQRQQQQQQQAEAETEVELEAEESTETETEEEVDTKLEEDEEHQQQQEQDLHEQAEGLRTTLQRLFQQTKGKEVLLQNKQDLDQIPGYILKDFLRSLKADSFEQTEYFQARSLPMDCLLLSRKVPEIRASVAQILNLYEIIDLSD